MLSKYLKIWVLLLVLIWSAPGCSANRTSQVPDTGAEPPPLKPLRVHFIDVGQGDAILIQTPAGQNMLVDAGENVFGDEVIDYLKAQEVNELVAVVGTHTHSDHIGGLDAVIDHFTVKAVYMPDVFQNTKSFRDVLSAVQRKGIKITTARAGVAIPLDDVECWILAPVKGYYEYLNDYSVVLRLAYGGQVFLLTGDAGSVPESDILASGANLKATVLKVGHHGSYASSSTPFLKAVGAGHGVIMLGKDNDYGYPHQSALQRLGRTGMQLYRTDLNGTTVFSTDGRMLDIATER